MQTSDSMRKSPRQARSGRTVETVLDAATQLLQAGGEATFTTNRIASRAGFSIGTLYQYFPNKQAIIAALVTRERDAIAARIHATLAEARAEAACGGEATTPEAAVRRVLRVLIGAFAGRRRARRFVLMAVLRGGKLDGLHAAQEAVLQEVVAALRAAGATPAVPLSSARLFVLSRAVLGAIRAAVLEENPLLESQAFEDELVHLMLVLLGPAPPDPSAPLDPGAAR